MLNEVESTSKRVWNVQELLKYNNNPRPYNPQILKNIEKAKQTDLTRSSTMDVDNDEERISRISLRSKPDLDPKSLFLLKENFLFEIEIESSKPTFKKELQPLTHKPSKNQRGYLFEIKRE